MTQSGSENSSERENHSGGSAAAGGMNFHARVAAIAAAHLLSAQRLNWFVDLVADVPTEIWCETNGPGDDIRLILSDRSIVEAQAKKGISRGTNLWDALTSLARGINCRAIDYGALVVDIDASVTVRSNLAKGVVRLGEGRTDNLDEITKDFQARLTADSLDVELVCSRLRIVVMHCADHDSASESVARVILRQLCGSESAADLAWKGLELLAHKLIERRGRWTGNEIVQTLSSSGVSFGSTANLPTSFSYVGWAWTKLDPLSFERDAIQLFRDHYLGSGKDSALPFGGRDTECENLDFWLANDDAPNRRLICAPTARGKSALLVRWTERLGNDTVWSVVFVPISLRYGTNRPTVFYALLAHQLARVLRVPLSPPSSDLDTFYQSKCAKLIRDAAISKTRIVIVIDGLDEAQAKGFDSTVFPAELDPCIKILCSAREHAGEYGPNGWMRRLGWERNRHAEAVGLASLDVDAIVAVLASAELSSVGDDGQFAIRLHELTAGEPLLVELYVEDLLMLRRSGAEISVEILAGMKPGFTYYFEQALQESILPPDSKAHDLVDAALSILAMTFGPIESPSLLELANAFLGHAAVASVDRLIKPIQRFVTGTGRTGQGFVLNHPKLGEYLREERFDQSTQKRVDQIIVSWGRECMNALHADSNLDVPQYFLRNYLSHLCRASAITLEDIELLHCDGWRNAWYRADKDHVGYADSLLEALKSLPRLDSFGSDTSRAIRARLKSCLYVSSIISQAANAPAELVALALAEDLITSRQAIDIAELQSPENQVGYLLAIASRLDQTRLDALYTRLLAIADNVSRLQELSKLAPYLRIEEQKAIIASAKTWISHDGNRIHQLGVLANLVGFLDEADMAALFPWITSVAHLPNDFATAVVILAPIIELLDKRDMQAYSRALQGRCITWARACLSVNQRAIAFRALAKGGMSSFLVEDANRALENFDNVYELLSGTVSSPWSFARALNAARKLEAKLTFQIIAMHDIPVDEYERRLQILLEPVYVPVFYMVDVLQNLIPIIRVEVRPLVESRAFEVAKELPSANNRTHGLLGLAKVASAEVRKSFVERALKDSRRIEDEYGVGLGLVPLLNACTAPARLEYSRRVFEQLCTIPYALHRGELLIRLSGLHPELNGNSDFGLSLLTMVEEVANVSATVLNNIENFRSDRRKAALDFCWQRFFGQQNPLTWLGVGLAAQMASEYWTEDMLEFVLKELPSQEMEWRQFTTASLIPVYKRFGRDDLIEATFAEILGLQPVTEALTMMVKAIELYESDASKMERYSDLWFQALQSENPNMDLLVLSYAKLHKDKRHEAWCRLIELARSVSPSSAVIGRLAELSADPTEREHLMRWAFEQCEIEPTTIRVTNAAQISKVCINDSEKYRALELMTKGPVSTRATYLSAMQFVAPAIHSCGGDSAINDIMEDILQCTTIWP